MRVLWAFCDFEMLLGYTVAVEDLVAGEKVGAAASHLAGIAEIGSDQRDRRILGKFDPDTGAQRAARRQKSQQQQPGITAPHNTPCWW